MHLTYKTFTFITFLPFAQWYIETFHGLLVPHIATLAPILSKVIYKKQIDSWDSLNKPKAKTYKDKQNEKSLKPRSEINQR